MRKGENAMSKKNKNKNENGNQEKKKEVKPIVVDEVKKQLAFEVISALIKDTSFPKVTKEVIAKIASDFKIGEKTVDAFSKKIEKFYSTITRGKKEKKGKKEVSADLEKQIQEIATVTAQNMSKKLFKCNAIFSEMVVLKKSKKENANANGRVIFKCNNKEYFLCWDYKNEDLFVGSTLHEYSNTIKENTSKKEIKKEESEKVEESPDFSQESIIHNLHPKS